MSKRVSSLFHQRFAGGSLLAVCLLMLAALLGAPSFAAAATATISTVYWEKGTAKGYEIVATVTTTSFAETVTLSGSGIPTTDLYATLEGEGLVYTGTATFTPPVGTTAPAVGASYTVNINYGTTTETIGVPITGVLGSTNIPGLTAPMGAEASSGSLTFHWTAPAALPGSFAGYKISVSDADSLQWSAEVPSTQTSVLYEGPFLFTGARYGWAAAAMDNNGNRAENRAGYFVPGANFSGKVTDINGSPLANIEVQAATIDGIDVGSPVITGADGTYIYAGLEPGEYQVHFDFQAYYWKNRLDRATADVLTVTADSLTSNINAVIGGWGAVAGSVYFPGYKPASGVKVTLLDLNKATVASVPAVTVPLTTSGFGNYYLALVRPGTYYLRYSAPGYSTVDKQVVVSLNRTLQGVPEVNHTFTGALPSTLTVQTSGSGTVTSSPAGISCASGSTAGCSSSYTAGTVVTLTATPTASSVFGAWSGACTGTGNCVVTVDTAKSVTATFQPKPATVRIDGNGTPYFSINTALDALPAVATLQTVRAKAVNFVENVLMVRPGVQVVLKGGYTDTAFTARTTTSRTAVDGSLKIRSGKLIAERLVIK